MLSKYIFLSLFIIAFTRCKKYPENDRIYLKTVKARLISHEWHFNKLTINGIDSTEMHTLKFGTSTPENVTINFDPDLNSLVLKYPTAPNSYVNKDIVFKEKKKKISIDEYQGNITNSIYVRLFILNEKHEWDIAKLTKNEFVLTGIGNNKEFRFEFIK
ncbi:MAG: hypothetical protein V4506_13985 [Bacteroidota bacterium]